MPTFKYIASGAGGGRQAGTISAPSAISARYELLGRQLQVRSLKERKKFTQIEITKKKIKPIDIANLSRQLSAFLRAGISIIDALEAISTESASPQLRSMLAELVDQLRAGDPFSETIAAHAEHFPSYFPGIIRSAELSGQLDMVLEQLAGYIDRDLETRRKIKSALTYPAILGVMSLVTVVVLIGFVLPKFKEFFEGMDATLPVTTKFLLDLGGFMGSYGHFVFASLGIIGVLMFLYARSEPGHQTRDRLSLRLPIMRDVTRASVIERFCRILSAMVQAGIPIADSMNAAIDSTDNRVFKKELIPASERMLRGEGLARPLAETDLFPGMVTQMMRVGEETGTLDKQLDIAADFYEKELTFKLAKLTSMFEPMVIIFMGLVVGFVAVALVQAMYGVYNQSSP
ncbi:MAG: type II secretion system F family protein [Acidimicrobiia bacterium]